MLTPFYTLIQSYGLKVKGIIHVGAHFGEEHEQYQQNGVEDIIFIEPCKPAFEKLIERVGDVYTIVCINKACGGYTGRASMYVETANNGQSNSLLQPFLHVTQYPNIVFDRSEDVQIDLLDNIYADCMNFAIESSVIHNMLVMDTQGFEMGVLTGANKTLEQIDYVYTEVNRAELYKDCTRIEALDTMLFEFERVNTNWAGGTWGDALYIRKTLK